MKSTKNKGGRPQGSKDKPKRLSLTIIATPPKKRVPWNKGKKTGLTPPAAFKARQWKPGQSGNPSGANGLTKRSADVKLLSEAYRTQLTEQCPIEGLEHLTWAEAIAIGMAAAAQRGDTPAAKELREVTEGKLPDHLRVGNPNGTPLERPVFDVHFVTPSAKKKAKHK